MERILRVNMSDGSVRFEEPGDYLRFRGRSLTSTVVLKETSPGVHALGAGNRLVIAPGLLSGTMAANSGRLSIGAKSPLTQGIKESNVGGTAANRLARLGVWAIIIEGADKIVRSTPGEIVRSTPGEIVRSTPGEIVRSTPGKLSCLLINKDGATLTTGDDLRGLGNYELAEKLRARHGDKVTVLSIGPAGENRLSTASIAVTDLMGRPSRHAGRGGLGAVMGAKGLKAIVIDDSGAEGVVYADKDAFKEAAEVFRDAISNHPVTKKGGGLSTLGTAVLVNVINEAGAFPTRNFSTGKFEGAAKISGEALLKTIKERGGENSHLGCTGCIIHCSNVYLDKDKNYLTSALEFETIWAHGAHLGIDDLDAIAQIDRLCDDYGLDTIEVGGAIGVVMEAGLRKFGDAGAAIELVHEAGKGTPLGRIIGSGAAVTGQVFGVERVGVTKRQHMPAYDPRGIKGMGVTYATTPMGADHTAGYAVAANIMRIGGFVKPLVAEGQVELSRKFQLASAILDASGLCTFVSFAVLDNKAAWEAIPRMINARYGWEMTPEDMQTYAKELLNSEREFNRKAGFTKLDDRLPEFFKTEPLAPHNAVFDVADEELDTTLEF